MHECYSNIDEHTRTKFLFYGGPDCLHMKDGLELYIDSSVIPDFLGGPCKVLKGEFVFIQYVFECILSSSNVTNT